jgi:hypothetical protein
VVKPECEIGNVDPAEQICSPLEVWLASAEAFVPLGSRVCHQVVPRTPPLRPGYTPPAMAGLHTLAVL